MKSFFFVLVTFFNLSSFAQFYYNDIVGTKETSDLIKNYRQNKVKRVFLISYDAENTRIEDLYVEQQLEDAEKKLRTITRSGVTAPSVLITYFNDAGVIYKTIDSGATRTTSTLYQYNALGNLQSLKITTVDTSLQLSETEEHRWQYVKDTISGMLRIMNEKDTTVIDFRTDEWGNVLEEIATRKGKRQEPVFYYYDKQHRLTDVVRYNHKAKRLMPEYMFEYSLENHVIQKITIPSHNANYLIWRYQYGSNGLKIKEAIYNRQKQLTGKIEYQYQFEN